MELDASADAATYTAGTLTFANIDVLHPVDDDGNLCSDVETVNKIFDDRQMKALLKAMQIHLQK